MYWVLPATRMEMLVLVANEVFRTAAPYVGALLLAARLGGGTRVVVVPA